ncbi:hypothetical protein [Klebsiella grimontii]|uniref:hypothetical protein n=1 Tax=Klebsiella grimontii TaxID=2058152 RepID=UPI002DBCB228|nr:hypothetical protein [Klebsiella grimontii]MEB8268771.1 hypothetical protein [Klebsiella grimontii]
MTTDITELAQRMRTAAEKLGADQWQARNGFSGTEVIVKGSLEKGAGCVSFQPVAADIADTKTARAIALFSPANVLALVEALEKALRANGYLREQSAEWERKAISNFEDCAEMSARIDELESRIVTVKLPEVYGYLRENDGQIQISIGAERPSDRSGGYATPWFAIYTAAGIKWEAE